MSDIENMIQGLTERQRDEFAFACAWRVEHLMTDPRSVAALDTRKRWLRGEATDEEMAAAGAAAWAAARAAAGYAAASAAWAPPWSAARAAAGDAWAAAGAAADAALEAERAWQREELERMLGERGGA